MSRVVTIPKEEWDSLKWANPTREMSPSFKAGFFAGREGIEIDGRQESKKFLESLDYSEGNRSELTLIGRDFSDELGDIITKEGMTPENMPEGTVVGEILCDKDRNLWRSVNGEKPWRLDEGR